MTGRVLEAFRALVAELMAPTAYHAPVRYRVVLAASGDRLELQIVRKGSGFPSTLPLSMQPGQPGAKGTPALGSTVLVQFIEGDPSLPVVTHFARPDEEGWKPTASWLDTTGVLKLGESATLVELAGGAAKVGRVGDTTHAGTIVLAHTPGGVYVSGAYFAGTTAGDAAAAAAVAVIVDAGNVPTLLTMTDGRITSGADKVKA